MATLTYELERGDDLIEMELEYEVASIDPGCGPSWNYAGDPPSGGEIEELTVLRDGKPFALTDAEQAKVEEFIADRHDYDDAGSDVGEPW
jgi:hypothetical protein